MHHPPQHRLLDLMHYTLALLCIWTIIIAGLLVNDFFETKASTNAIALSTARAHLNNENSFRFWAASHGGICVPTKLNQPSPDIPATITPTGNDLTLTNPAYMLRHLNDIFSNLYGVAGHITSINPLRPEDKPDKWETDALHSFASGEKEAITIIKNKDTGDQVLRLMQPLYIKPLCLQCHNKQKYKIGCIRGGISISLPMEIFLKDARRQFTLHLITFIFLWIVGIIGIALGSKRLKIRTSELSRSYLALQQEVTVRTKAEIALQQESSFTAAIMDTAATLIMVLDTSGKIIRFNHTCEQLSGYSFKEVVNKKFGQIFLSPKETEEMDRALSNLDPLELPQKVENHIITKDQKTVAIDWSYTTFPTEKDQTEYIICTGIDITEERQLQAQLLHAEKLSAAGKLSASIAHEINSPLFGIRNVLERLKDREKLSSNNQNFTELAIQECDRIKRLITNLQDFNRPTSGIMAPINLPNTIDNMLRLTKKEMANKKISVNKDYDPALPQINGIADQIKQVLLNLLNNAMEACNPGSKVNISTRKSGEYATIKISDTGTGINSDNLPYIFDPFFTTKTAVKGTGLGLSISYGIIKRHNGSINVTSEPNVGTTFTIELPLARRLSDTHNSTTN